MNMATTLQEKLQSLPSERQAKIARLTEELTLQELRKKQIGNWIIKRTWGSTVKRDYGR